MSGNLCTEDIMGLHSFRNPQEAWNVMCANWGADPENMAIIDDKWFCQTIIERAIIAIVETAIGKHTEDWLNESLRRGSNETDYLVYQNFFYYSELTEKFYTSILEVGDFYYLANYSETEKRIIDELFYIHDVDSLVDIAIDFVSDNSCLFKLYDPDKVLDAFLDLYWDCVA